MKNNLRIIIPFIVFITCILIPFIAGAAKPYGEPEDIRICNETADAVPVINITNQIPVIITENADIVEPPQYARIKMYDVPVGTLLTIKYISLLGFAINVLDLDMRPTVIIELIKDEASKRIAIGAADFAWKTASNKRCFVLAEAMSIQVPEKTQVYLVIMSTPNAMSMAEGSLVGQSETFAY